MRKTALIFLAAAAQVCAGLTLTTRQGSPATLYTGCKDPQTVAMTFVESFGPTIFRLHTHSQMTRRNISDIFTSAGGHCTFLLNGADYACIYGATQVNNLKYAFAAGHQLASLTWSHLDLTTLSANDLRTQVSKLDLAMSRIVGAMPTCLVPPFGSFNDTVLAIVGETKPAVVLWDYDGTNGSPSDIEAGYDSQVASAITNMLALNEETTPTTASQVMPHVVNSFVQAGYKLITVAECIGVDAYYNRTTPTNRTVDWHC
ncbi:unnamed protein product [Mycena citricolor]|uniref:NodB homology domain-containing protein n=1 Tax=Mycena citricolor TaxID=2018698 RepID=A0AAD2H638_9AGAR|nr:unnamed protein product [Mycena citricolor]CAK5269415.1 unnamed protein product [Mycena citricolor]